METHAVTSSSYLKADSKNAKTWLTVSGLILLALGLLALFVSIWTTFLSVLFVGCLFIVSSVSQIAFTANSGRHNWAGFVLHLFLAIFYAIGGLLLISNPLMGAVSLTIVIGFFLIVSGAFRVAGALSQHFHGWQWALFSGLISVFLGAVTLYYLPATSMFLIGTLVGIDLLAMGSYLFVTGLSLPSAQAQTPIDALNRPVLS